MDTQKKQLKSTQGRPRSATSEQSILDAALDLLQERSLRELTIEAVAERAGVGKATIYRWWPTKAHLALDAYLRHMGRAVEARDSGSAERDFLAQLLGLIELYESPRGRILKQFLAECQADAAFASLYRERFLHPRREAVRCIWRRGVEQGEIDGALDCELILDMIFAPLVYRLLAGHAPFTGEDAENLVRAVFRGIGPSATLSLNESRKAEGNYA